MTLCNYVKLTATVYFMMRCKTVKIKRHASFLGPGLLRSNKEVAIVSRLDISPNGSDHPGPTENMREGFGGGNIFYRGVSRLNVPTVIP